MNYGERVKTVLVVGLLTIELYLAGVTSLKEKRRIIKSLIARLRNRYNISVAEVGGQECWQRATLGVSFVSGESGRVHSVLEAVVNFVEAEKAAEIISCEKEIW